MTVTENKQLQVAFELACKFIEEFTGTCPSDRYDWEDPDNECGAICGIDGTDKCWRTYYLQVAQERIDKEAK